MLKKIAPFLVSCISIGLISVAPAIATTYTDDFKTLRTDFSNPYNAQVSVKDGALHMKGIDDVSTFTILNKSLIISDMDMSVSVKKDGLTKDKDGSIGLVFWAADISNWYGIKLGDSGQVVVSRLVGNKRWVPQVDWHEDPAYKSETDWNDLRVVTKGNHCTCYVNGKKIGEFDGQPPDGGGQFGFETFGSPEAQFKNLKIEYQ